MHNWPIDVPITHKRQKIHRPYDTRTCLAANINCHLGLWLRACVRAFGGMSVTPLLSRLPYPVDCRPLQCNAHTPDRQVAEVRVRDGYTRTMVTSWQDLSGGEKMFNEKDCFKQNGKTGGHSDNTLTFFSVTAVGFEPTPLRTGA